MSTLDENDRLREGTLPEDPFEDTDPVRPAPAPDSEPPVDPFAATWRPMPPDWLDPANAPPPRTYLLIREEPGADGRGRWVGVLPRGKVGMLAAAGAVGKTMALVQLAIAVATGGRWLGRQDRGAWVGGFQVATPGRVLFAMGEEDDDEARRRLFNAARELGLTSDDRRKVLERVIVLPLAGTTGLGLTDADGKPTGALEALRSRLEADDGEGWALVALDPASRFAGVGMEVDNALATGFVEVLEQLCKVRGSPTVLIAHHTSQASRQLGDRAATAARGVTAFSDGVRWQAVMAPPPKYQGGDAIAFAVPKNNYAPHAPEIYLTRSKHTGVLRCVDDEEHAAIEAAAASTKKKPEAPTEAPTRDPILALLERPARGQGSIAKHIGSGQWDWRLDDLRKAERAGRNRPQVIGLLDRNEETSGAFQLGKAPTDEELLASLHINGDDLEGLA